MTGLCDGGNEPPGSLKAICKSKIPAAAENRTHDLKTMRFTRCLLRYRGHELYIENVIGQCNIPVFLLKIEKLSGWKISAPGEDRTHDLKIMRLTRCLLRYRGHELYVENVIGQCNIPVFLQKIEWVENICPGKLSGWKISAPGEDRTHDLKIMRLTRCLLRYRGHELYVENKIDGWKISAPGEDRTHDLKIMRLTRCLLRYRGHELYVANVVGQCNIPVFLQKIEWVENICPGKLSGWKISAPGEDRTHDLKIMRLTRCLLRYRGHELYVANVVGQCNIPVFLQKIEWVENICPGKLSGWKISAPGEDRTHDLKIMRLTRCLLRYRGHELYVENVIGQCNIPVFLQKIEWVENICPGKLSGWKISAPGEDRTHDLKIMRLTRCLLRYRGHELYVENVVGQCNIPVFLQKIEWVENICPGKLSGWKISAPGEDRTHDLKIMRLTRCLLRYRGHELYVENVIGQCNIPVFLLKIEWVENICPGKLSGWKISAPGEDRTHDLKIMRLTRCLLRYKGLRTMLFLFSFRKLSGKLSGWKISAPGEDRTHDLKIMRLTRCLLRYRGPELYVENVVGQCNIPVFLQKIEWVENICPGKLIGWKISAPGEDRTHDLKIMRLTRCLLRYRGHELYVENVIGQCNIPVFLQKIDWVENICPGKLSGWKISAPGEDRTHDLKIMRLTRCLLRYRGHELYVENVIGQCNIPVFLQKIEWVENICPGKLSGWKISAPGEDRTHDLKIMRLTRCLLRYRGPELYVENVVGQCNIPVFLQKIEWVENICPGKLSGWKISAPGEDRTHDLKIMRLTRCLLRYRGPELYVENVIGQCNIPVFLQKIEWVENICPGKLSGWKISAPGEDRTHDLKIMRLTRCLLRYRGHELYVENVIGQCNIPVFLQKIEWVENICLGKLSGWKISAPGEDRTHDLKIMRLTRCLLRYRGHELYVENVIGQCNIPVFLQKIEWVENICPGKYSGWKISAPGEDRTHDLKIMRLTRCLLRYRGHELYVENVIGQCNIPVFLQKIEWVENICPGKLSGWKISAPGEDRTHDLKIMRLTRCLLRYRGHELYVENKIEWVENICPGEDRTHDLKIMRLTRCLLRYRGPELYVENVIGQCNIPVFLQKIEWVENICPGEDRTHDLKIMRLTRCLLRYRGHELYVENVIGQCNIPVFLQKIEWVENICPGGWKISAPGEDRTHDLKIMRLTRCLLRYRGHELYVENVIGQCNIPVFLQKIEWVENICPGKLSGWKISAPGEDRTHDLKIMRFTRCLLRYRGHEWYVESVIGQCNICNIAVFLLKIEKLSGWKISVPGEDRTHDLKIMRLTRCLLRYRGHELYVENVVGQCNIPVFLLKIDVVSVKNYVVSVKCVVSVKKYVVSVKCAVDAWNLRGYVAVVINYGREGTTAVFSYSVSEKARARKPVLCTGVRLEYDVNMLGENTQTVRENAGILLEASKAIGLEVNPEKTKYMIMSRDGNIVRNGNINIGDLSFEEVEKFKYLGATVTNINDTREEIKRRINMGNACYYSVEKLLSSSLLSKNLKVRIYKTVILPVLLYGCETWTLTLREEHRLRVFENKVLRKIFGAKRDEVTGEWRKLHNTELHAL
ncbi:hypothetical protein ANN_16649 [Periplaneta americana]|uniref:Uncharacterized protein n=1 Tax=Periplaneta americana TaxID=6978 RepID=A0ABQ8SQZ3_PERAM|nr:hypothetical protein ANN_16649 [Periplaneta americana]